MKSVAPLWVTKDELFAIVQQCAPHIDREAFEYLWRSNQRRNLRKITFANQRRAAIRLLPDLPAR